MAEPPLLRAAFLVCQSRFGDRDDGFVLTPPAFKAKSGESLLHPRYSSLAGGAVTADGFDLDIQALATLAHSHGSRCGPALDFYEVHDALLRHGA